MDCLEGTWYESRAPFGKKEPARSVCPGAAQGLCGNCRGPGSGAWTAFSKHDQIPTKAHRVASVRPLLQGHHFQHRERFLSSSAFFSSKKRRVGVGSHFRCFGGSTSRTPARSPASTWLLGPKALRTKSRGSALIPGQALGVEVPDGEEPGLMAVGTQAPRGENKCQLRCLGINLRFRQTKGKP